MRKLRSAPVQNAALFSYRQGDSFMHRVPPLIKFLLLSFICFRTFSNSAYFGLADSVASPQTIAWLRTACYFVVQAVIFIAAKTPVANIKKMKFILVIGIPLILLRSLRTENIETPGDLFNAAGFFDGALYVVRFYITSASAMVIFETTSRLELFNAFYNLEDGIARFIPGVKKLNAAAALSITIAFIPEIFSAWNAITFAAAARTPRRNTNILLLIRNITAEFTGLFSAMIDYAEQLRRAAANRTANAKETADLHSD